MSNQAENILSQARDLLDPEGKRSLGIPRGFAWWGKDFRTEAVVVLIPGQTPVFRVGSDMWRGFEGSDADYLCLDSIMKNSTLSAPARIKTDPTRLGLWVDIPLDQEKGSWMAGFLALVVAHQNAEAERFGKMTSSWKADCSRPPIPGGKYPAHMPKLKPSFLPAWVAGIRFTRRTLS